MDAGDDGAPVASTSKAGAAELASMKSSASSSPKKRKRQATAASSDHPDSSARTRAVDVEDDDNRAGDAQGTPGKRKRTRNKKTLQAASAEDQMNDAASASSRSGASLSHSRSPSGSSTPVAVEAQGNGKGKGKGTSKISSAASSVDAGPSTAASSSSREQGQSSGEPSQPNGHGAGAGMSRSELKEFKQAKLQEFVTTVEDAYRKRNPGVTPEAWDQDHELRMKMARDMLSQAFTSGPPAPTDPPPPLPLYRKAMDAQMREALGVPAKGRHKKSKAEKLESKREEGPGAAGPAAASASASTSASASHSGESGSSDEDDDDDDGSSGAFDFSGLKTEMGDPRYEPRETGQATPQELALPNESFKERMYRMANGAVVKDRSERARLRRAAKEQLLERAENPRPDTAEEAEAKTATQARKAEKRRKQKELRRARLEKEASKPGTTPEDAEKLRDKAERLRVAEEKAMLKAQKKQENLERHQQQVEAARQRKAEKAQQAKNALVIDESGREEGELGLGDLFVVDTTPADLPDELKRTREAQEQAQREAAQSDVPLHAAAPGQSAVAATVPSYAGTSGTQKEAQPRYLGISGRELEPNDDDSESDDDGGTDEAPTDLAVSVHSEATAAGGGGPAQPAAADDLGLPLDDLDEEADFRQENRYFKEEDPTKICRRCGETGHLMRDCEHIQCMTCGKLDDHEQRNCPVTMTCHRCGSRGHFVSDCSLAPGESRNNRTCERCSSRMHQSTNCPYIWRVYIRSTTAPRNPVKYNFSCYNCASGEHFGDDCPKPRGHPLKFVDRSAFTINTERPHNRSTLDPGPPLGMRAGQLAGDGGMSGATTEDETPLAPYKGSGGRPNIINGKRAPASLPPRPPSDAPRGPKALAGGDAPGNKTKTQLRNEGRDFQKEVHDAIQSQSRASTYTSQKEKAGLVDFGNLDDLEEGEEDEEDDFTKRLKGKDGRPRPPPKLSGGQRPGARDRKKARSQEGSEAGSVDGRSGGSSKAGTGKTFQPFKNFNEAGGNKGLSGVRSRSRSPQRHDRSRQPSPPAPDWRQHRDRGEPDDPGRRDYSGAHSRSELLSQRLDDSRGSRGGRGRVGSSHASDRNRDRDYSRGGPSTSARSSGGSSLLDRIENGRAPTSRDDYRNFPRGRQDSLAGGDSYVSLSSDDRRSGDSRGGGGGGGGGGRGGKSDSGGYRGGKHRGGKYRGGYM